MVAYHILSAYFYHRNIFTHSACLPSGLYVLLALISYLYIYSAFCCTAVITEQLVRNLIKLLDNRYT